MSSIHIISLHTLYVLRMAYREVNTAIHNNTGLHKAINIYIELVLLNIHVTCIAQAN